jgi:hypothetical protein
LPAESGERDPPARKRVVVRHTDQAPDIDGFIEPLWESGSAVEDMIQFFPYEKSKPSERTVVYLLQDDANLYIGMQMFADSLVPIACLTSDEDQIAVQIDPFGSGHTAYYFNVFASGVFNDGWVFDNGRTWDDSWDGVWYSSVGVYEDRWEVELKIPFKSIRFKKGLSEWGANFGRYMSCVREWDTWSEFLQSEGNMVSKYGTLAGIEPRVTGYYFELYPEGFLRYDKRIAGDGSYETDLRPKASFNLRWDVTPNTALNATAYPDFAQIESDPFQLNLGRYPIHYRERRPFFLEGFEIFRMSSLGEDFFRPLELFYSRKIGRTIDDDAVDIMGGLKLIHKSETWNLGVLGAYTDEYVESDSILEPRRGFGVFKGTRRVFGSSDVGLLFAGMYEDEDDHNYALGLDLAHRTGYNRLILQGAVSERNEKRGFAFSGGYDAHLGGFAVGGVAEVVHDSFDVSEIGFVPWAGLKRFMGYAGPNPTYPEGALRNLYFGPGIEVTQEPGDTNWSTVLAMNVNPEFRNDWGIWFSLFGGKMYQADTNYFHRGLELSVWGPLCGYYLNFGTNVQYNYNYWRGFPAYQAWGWGSWGFMIIPEVSLTLFANWWLEWDDQGYVLGLTPMFRPGLHFRPNPYFEIRIRNEFVWYMPEGRFSDLEWLSNRWMLYFGWNFKPKSWIYIAINDYRVQDQNGNLSLQNRIGAIKVKYLIYF